MSCSHGVGDLASIVVEQTADHAHNGQSSTKVVNNRTLHRLELE